jgi:uncharacterized membrane protein (UPF0136 family)
VSKSLSLAVVVFGLAVVAGGVIGWTKGSNASLFTAVPMGLLVVGSGVAMLRGLPRATLVALLACAAVAVVMLQRLLETGKVMPAVPVAVAGAVLAFLLLRANRPAA